MAVRTRYVDTASTSGGNGTTQSHSGANRAYAALQDCMLAEAANLVSAGDSLVVYCAGSAADVTPAYLWTGSGWTTDATHNVSIRADPTAPDNDGLNLGNAYSTGHYRLENASSSGFRVIGTDVEFIGIQFGYNVSAGGGSCIIDEGSGTINISGCRFKSLLTPASQSNCLTQFNAAFTVTNSTIEWTTATNCCGVAVGSTMSLTNCTITGATFGCYIPSGTLTVKNCAVFNCSDDFLISGTLVASYIAHDDASETGESNHIDISPGGTESTDWNNAFAGYSSGDFRVKDASSVLYNAGTNTGAPATDIIGTSRPQSTTVDVGAWEFGAAPPPQDLTPGFFRDVDPVAVVTHT